MTVFDPRYYVSFISDSNLEFTVLVGEQSPVIVDGHGGWEVVDRPKRKGMTRYKGKNPYKQDIQIRFDGYLDGFSQESDINILMRMDSSPSIGTPPPLITVSGFALMTNLTWVIENIEWDPSTVIWAIQGGVRVRLRQDATVHLMEFVDDDIVTTAPSPAVQNAPGKKNPATHVVFGETLKQVAQEVYGDPSKYFPITIANPFITNDPRVIIPSGTILSIPPMYGYAGNPFTVQ